MKEKNSKEASAKKPKKKQAPKSLINIRWVFLITLISFFTAGTLSFFSTSVLDQVNGMIPYLVLLFFILLGIGFDMIGIASTTATEKEFHSMSAKQIVGARQAVNLVRNADRVSSFCNDVVGDISGIISGATGAIILSRLMTSSEWESFLLSFAMAGVVSALTIGGKAMGKSVAIGHCHKIIFFVGRVMAAFSFFKGKKGK